MRSIHFWIKGSLSQFSLSTITNHFVSLRLRVFTQILEEDSLWRNYLSSLLPLHFFSPPLSSCITVVLHRTSIVAVFVAAPTTADRLFDCVCSRTMHLHRIVSRTHNLCSRVSDRLPSLSGKSISINKSKMCMHESGCQARHTTKSIAVHVLLGNKQFHSERHSTFPSLLGSGED